MSDSYTPFAPIQYDQAAVSRQGWGMANSGSNDEQLIVAFYPYSQLNKFKSNAEGKPVYETKDFVSISHPGETMNVVKREATEGDKRRFARHWNAYQQGKNQVPDGVPLTLLFPSAPHIVETLRGYNIHTVEQLANLSAHGIGSVGMGCQEWVNGAKRYMERADKGVNHHKFEMALAEKDRDIATLKRQIQELSNLVNSRTAPQINMQTHDFQSEQIANSHMSADPSQSSLQPPAQFVQNLASEVQPSKPRGRPAGSKNKPKET